MFIGNLNIFPLISTSDILSFSELTPGTEKYRSVWRHIITFATDKVNLSFEGLDIYIVLSLIVQLILPDSFRY
jgi:hypothetical protein